jgi:hypothetical protein
MRLRLSGALRSGRSLQKHFPIFPGTTSKVLALGALHRTRRDHILWRQYRGAKSSQNADDAGISEPSAIAGRPRASGVCRLCSDHIFILEQDAGVFRNRTLVAFDCCRQAFLP